MIGFLHPWLLLGLVAAAVPFLLHLRQHREPPTVTFPAVRYLLDATRQHERRLRLRHWLLLLLRTVLILALVLAAATIYFGIDTEWSAGIAARAAEVLLGGLR